MKRLSIKRALELVRATEEFIKNSFIDSFKDEGDTITKIINSTQMKYDLHKIINEMDLLIDKSKEENDDPCYWFKANKMFANAMVNEVLHKRGVIDLLNVYKNIYEVVFLPDLGDFEVFIADCFSDIAAYRNYLHYKVMRVVNKSQPHPYYDDEINFYESSLFAFKEQNMLKSYIQNNDNTTKKGKRGKARPKYL